MPFSLQYLSVDNNKLTSLPPLEKLISLQYLRVTNNKLTSLPSIEKLVFDEQKITREQLWNALENDAKTKGYNPDLLENIHSSMPRHNLLPLPPQQAQSAFKNSINLSSGLKVIGLALIGSVFSRTLIFCVRSELM